MNRKAIISLALALVMALFAVSALADYTAGTYTASANGNNGPVTVEVEFNESAIVSVTVTEHGETAGISDTAFERIPAAIVDGQTLAVDTVSGATNSSNAILTAVADCVAQAGGDVEALKTKEAEEDISSEPIDATADVIVVGGGGAGLSAAIAAAEAGSSVILIEKTGVLGGNTILSGGSWNAVDPDMINRTETVSGQIETLEEYLEKDPADYFGEYADALVQLQDEIREYLAGDTTMMFDSVTMHIIQCYEGGLRQDLDGNWIYGDYALVKNFCEQSLPTLQWINQNWKMPFKDTLTTVYGGLWKRGHSPIEGASKGSDYFRYGKEYADELGVQFMMDTAATSIVMQDGRAVGIVAEQKSGTPVTLHANKGVVLATGGYGGSVELVKEYNNFWPALPEEITTNNAPGVTGDGIFMAREIGADLVGMEFVQLLALAHPFADSSTGINGNPDQTLYVNKEGVRFVNEYEARDVIAAASLAQTDGMFYSIDDVDSVHVRHTDAQLDKWADQGNIWVADTLEELAEKLGIDPEVLVNTVETYNGYVEAGVDPDFGKNIMDLTIKTGPFYASPHKPAIHHTMGGIHINTNTEVIDTEGNVIPGLFAAGEVTGGIHAGNRLGGNAVADAFTYGRIAGAHAAAN